MKAEQTRHFWLVVFFGTIITLVTLIFANENEPMEYNEPDQDKIETVVNDTTVFGDKSNEVKMIIERPE